MKDKKVTINAFTVEYDSITSNFNLMKMLSDKLNGSTLKDRLMPLNGSEGEACDLLSEWSKGNSFIKSRILPVVPNDSTSELPKSILDKPSVTAAELEKYGESSGDKFTTLPPCYFIANHKYILTVFPSGFHKNRLETYLNWIFEKDRGDKIIRLLPVLREMSSEEINRITAITFDEGKTEIPIEGQGNPIFNWIKKDIKPQMLKFLGVEDLGGIDINDVFSIKVVLGLKRKVLSKEEKSRSISHIVRMIGDENVSYKSKGKNVPGSRELRATKSVNLSLTAKGGDNEAALYLDMEGFLKEILSQED